MKNRSTDIAFLILAVDFFLQCLISFTVENILSAFLVSFTTALTFVYLFGKGRAFSLYPLSSLPILGLNISSQSGALLYQTITWVPLEFNLYAPAQTFLYVGLMQLTLVAAHFFYTHSRVFSDIRNGFSNGFIKPLGLFAKPSTTMLWFAGFVGVIAIWFAATKEVAYGDVGGKFFVAFLPFAYAPYLIPFYHWLSNGVKSRGSSVMPLLAYTLLIVVVALARNSRGTFALAFMTIILVFCLFLAAGHIKLSRRQITKATLLLIPVFGLMWILSDLAVAMVIVRSSRSDVMGWDLIELTFNTLQDREALTAYKNSAQFLLMNEYNESYISNPIIARLVTVKFDDNMLYFYSLLPPQASSELLDVTLSKFIALLPTPLINLFGLGVSKEELGFSIGDYIWYLVSGVGLGGLRTGSIVAHGLILFDWLFFFLIFILVPILYAIFDSFSYGGRRKLYFSPIILFVCFPLFSTFNGDGLNNIANFVLRGFPQMILLYLILRLPFTLRLSRSIGRG